MPDADHRRAIRQAMLRPERFLAAALAERPDEDLAAAIGAPAAQCWRLRLMGWPRNDCWGADVEQMAAAVDADPRLLGWLLVKVGTRA